MKSGWPSGQALFCSSAPAPDSSSSDAGPLPTPLLQAWSLWGQQPAEGRARLRQSVSSGLLPGTTAEHKRSPHPLPRGLPDGFPPRSSLSTGDSADSSFLWTNLLCDSLAKSQDTLGATEATGTQIHPFLGVGSGNRGLKPRCQQRQLAWASHVLTPRPVSSLPPPGAGRTRRGKKKGKWRTR